MLAISILKCAYLVGVTQELIFRELYSYSVIGTQTDEDTQHESDVKKSVAGPLK